ncbi:MAG TPA: MauE/DoxX family redox-associated membrane protein [Candidatus Aminicenantes bacterium]|nr:MauE/DoxX family redox-associated membrane protein [Candidatus Aminicenantes bacterium]HRY63764.1 MauE/DoxX family redox-associated membrane protein [Candidatus Aminicenantes bacterium]HRZ70677.1 MauE/DoxX family redox-associated membrane protein [Candidatus Aminicenantes bacterium]
MIRNRTVLVVFRVVLGGLFIYAGVVKALEPLDFAQNIRNYRLVGQSLSFAAALVLPWLEILAGAFLAAGIWKRGAALVISALLAFFIVLTAVTMARGLDVDCGCFGPVERKAGWGVILEDLAMLYAGLALLLARRPRPWPGPASAPHSGPRG